ncbi:MULTISPECIES: helix-turn-helix transcriptional regulator [Gammaproteobacteria]|uniref:helix-turn-helix transcriptional regulator n=2 Tax=Pseudomonadota TaxID=1224 RepID=UPI0032995D06
MMASAPKGSDNPTAMPPPVARALRKLGHDLSVARRMRRMTQQDLAQRMDTSVSTVRRMEDGNPGTALHTFLRALHVLGRLEDMVRIMALDQDALGLELTQEQLPQRVRSSGGKKTKARPPGAPAKGGKTAGDDDELEGF